MKCHLQKRCGSGDRSTATTTGSPHPHRWNAERIENMASQLARNLKRPGAHVEKRDEAHIIARNAAPISAIYVS